MVQNSTSIDAWSECHIHNNNIWNGVCNRVFQLIDELDVVVRLVRDGVVIYQAVDKGILRGGGVSNTAFTFTYPARNCVCDGGNIIEWVKSNGGRGRIFHAILEPLDAFLQFGKGRDMQINVFVS